MTQKIVFFLIVFFGIQSGAWADDDDRDAKRTKGTVQVTKEECLTLFDPARREMSDAERSELREANRSKVAAMSEEERTIYRNKRRACKEMLGLERKGDKKKPKKEKSNKGDSDDESDSDSDDEKEEKSEKSKPEKGKKKD